MDFSTIIMYQTIASSAPSESDSDRSVSPPPPIRRDSPEMRDHSSKYKSVQSAFCLVVRGMSCMYRESHINI